MGWWMVLLALDGCGQPQRTLGQRLAFRGHLRIVNARGDQVQRVLEGELEFDRVRHQLRFRHQVDDREIELRRGADGRLRKAVDGDGAEVLLEDEGDFTLLMLVLNGDLAAGQHLRFTADGYVVEQGDRRLEIELREAAPESG